MPLVLLLTLLVGASFPCGVHAVPRQSFVGDSEFFCTGLQDIETSAGAELCDMYQALDMVALRFCSLRS
jgi:hypothetical protein